jgi:ABC-type transport system substrate-binding protein
MTKKFSIVLAMVMIIGTVSLAACSNDNGEKTTTPTTTTQQTTTPAPTTEPEGPTTTEPEQPTTEPEEPTTTEPSGPAGEPTAENAPAIVNHPVGPGYDGLCGICHMIGGTDPMPDDGYHEDFDVDECYDCHKEG